MTIPSVYPFAHAFGCQCMMCIRETIVPMTPTAPWPPSFYNVTSITPTGPAFAAPLKTPQRFQSRFRARRGDK